MDYIDINKGIFIGLDKEKTPQYIPVKDWQKQHADIIGTTGAGKGVASGILLYQSILPEKVFLFLIQKMTNGHRIFIAKHVKMQGNRSYLSTSTKTNINSTSLKILQRNIWKSFSLRDSVSLKKGKQQTFIELMIEKLRELHRSLSAKIPEQQFAIFITVNMYKGLATQ